MAGSEARVITPVDLFPTRSLDRWLARNILRHARSVADERRVQNGCYYDVSTLHNACVMGCPDYRFSGQLPEMDKNRGKQSTGTHLWKVVGRIENRNCQ